MILVDTTVWVDFFAGKTLAHVQKLEELLLTEGDVCICGVILTETLQGIRSDSDYRIAKAYFESLAFLPMTHATFIHSSELYRSLRKRGITIRKSIDCMIASVAIEHNVPLLHNDRDFERIADCSRLRLVNLKRLS